MMNYSIVDKIILNALEEDIPFEDITTNALVSADSKSTVDLITKEEGILAGSHVFTRVFDLLGDVEVTFYKNDGDVLVKGEKIAHIKGNTRNILTGERTALNLLQRMSGVASLTSKFKAAIAGTNAQVVDTRKTTPGLRVLEKYAVKIGGGGNHRYNLSDGIMLKDNHIGAAGSIKKAVEMVRIHNSFVRKVEVETENLQMVQEALDAGADIIMLDNMDLDTIIEAVKLIDKKALVECSGNVSLSTIGELAKTGVDIISVGELTHSAKILDFSMKNLTPIN